MGILHLKAVLASFLTYLVWILLTPFCLHLFRILPLPEPMATYLGTIGSSIAMATGVLLSARILMRKPLLACISDQPHFSRFLVPFLCGIGCFTLFTLLRIALAPNHFTWQAPQARTYVAMLLLVLVMNTIQCASEEFMMRIFPSHALPDRLGSSLLCTLLFLLPHLGNAELKEGNAVLVLFSYVIFGFWGTWESLAEGGFGYSLGIHMANNLVVSLLVGYKSTALRTYPLFMTSERSGNLGELLTLVATLSITSLFSRRFLTYTRNHHGKQLQANDKAQC
ncbi:MAG: hypothetical protein SPF89_00835 [Sphaerochaetaceae bacterium]|nr:hypothetical protein [Spirochaetales bacterium]MDY5498629.1 hypothetical protein [Sphaerochaetaceae bacterium]